MAGDKSAKRAHAVAIRAAKLRAEGYTLSEIAWATGIDRKQVVSRIQLGERLLSVSSDALAGC